MDNIRPLVTVEDAERHLLAVLVWVEGQCGDERLGALLRRCLIRTAMSRVKWLQ